MKIAYLVLCHNNENYVARLVNKVLYNTENEVFIHVDLKASENNFKDAITNYLETKNRNDLWQRVTFIKERKIITWAGYNSIEATVSLMKEAHAKGDFKYYVLLQGADYPLLSNENIDLFFANNYPKEFLKAGNISVSSKIYDQHKYRLFYCLDKKNIFFWKVIHKLNYEMCKRNKILNLKNNYVFDNNGRKLYIYQGVAQFALTDKAISYIIKFHDTNKDFNKYFSTMFAPDESYFHTIIFNSSFVKNTPLGKDKEESRLEDYRSITYFEYPVNVTVFKSKYEYNKLKESGCLYFRKATDESIELLDYIDEKTG